MPETTTPTIVLNTSTGKESTGKSSMYKTGALVVGGVGAAYLIKKWWDKKKAEELAKKYANNPGYQKALQLRNAFNPSGISWMIDFDGTVESAVLETIATLKDKAEWDTMVTIYQDAYGESLIDRTNKELGTDDLAKFNQLLQARMAGKSVVDIITPPAPGKVTANWVGKRVRLKKGIDNYKYWSAKSDIGAESKTKTAILDLAGGANVPASWTKDWRVSNRTTQTLRVTISVFPLTYATVVTEFLQLKIPSGTSFTYVWVNAGNWELV